MNPGPVTSGELRYDDLCWPKPDQRLLLESLHLPPGEALAAYADWRARVNLDTLDAGSLSLLPLLNARLTALGVADPILRRLKGTHRRSWLHGQLLARGAMQAVDLLATRKIPLLALKGLALLDAYAGDVGLRPMSDVDLLLPRERALEAFDVLLRAGFELRPPLSRTDLAAKLDSFHGWSVGAGRVEIDLHWASLIEDLSPQGDARLWHRAEEWTFLERRLLRPSLTDRLFHVCVHGARWSRTMSITWAADGVRLLDRTRGAAEIDWRALIAEAHARRLQIPLRETLRFLREVLRADVPVAVLSQLEPPEPAWLYWYDHHTFSADPRKSHALHRAAAQVVAKLRAGQAVEGIPAQPRGA